MYYRFSILLSVFLILAFCYTSPADEQTIKFELVGNKLTLTQKVALPQLSVGDNLVVEVENVKEPKSDWTFKLDGDQLEMKYEENKPLHFDITIKSGKEDSKNLTFVDASNKVTYDGIPDTGIPSEVKSKVPGKTNVVKNSEIADKTYKQKKLYDRAKNEINLYFDGNGLSTSGFPTDVDDNDVINIFLVATKNDIKNLMVEVSGSLTGEEIAIQGLAALVEFKKALRQEQPQVFDMGSYGPYAPPSITIVIKELVNGKANILRSYIIKINKNYLASLRFGVGQSKIRFNEYKLRQFAGSEDKRIKNISSEGGEPQDFLSIVFYGWHFWEDRFWNGRDVSEPPDFIGRINPFVGLSFTEFGKKYQFGLSFELARGLDLFYGVHIAKTKVLNGGFKEGDTFSGQESDIPTKEKWITDKKLIGLSVDLRIATKILSTLLGG
jgi:hypothetical protein